MKLCHGTGEKPRQTSERAYCPQCHRPVRFKTIETVNMVTRHYPNGLLVNLGPRGGYRH